MTKRVRVAEASRLTGVPGDEIYLAIRRGELRSERDPRGYDWVDPAEVERLERASH